MIFAAHSAKEQKIKIARKKGQKSAKKPTPEQKIGCRQLSFKGLFLVFGFLGSLFGNFLGLFYAVVAIAAIVVAAIAVKEIVEIVLATVAAELGHKICNSSGNGDNSGGKGNTPKQFLL